MCGGVESPVSASRPLWVYFSFVADEAFPQAPSAPCVSDVYRVGYPEFHLKIVLGEALILYPESCWLLVPTGVGHAFLKCKVSVKVEEVTELTGGNSSPWCQGLCRSKPSR